MIAFKVPTYFTAIDKYSRVVEQMSKTVGKFSDANVAALQRTQKKFDSISKSAMDFSKQTAVGAAVIAAPLVLASKNAMDYEKALLSLKAVTGVSNEQLAEFDKIIQKTAFSSKKSMIEVANSFEIVGSAMSQYLDNPKALNQITEAGIILSKASKMELEPSLEALTTVMNQFKVPAEQALNVINRLTAGEIVGSTSTAQVADMLKQFGAVAKGSNTSIAESVALVETLGIQMDKAAVGVGARNLLTILSAAGGLDKKARADLTASGVSMNLLMDNTKSLSEKLHELSKIANDPIKMVSVFGKENLTTGSVIFQNLATYDKWVKEIEKTNQAQKQAQINSSGVNDKFQALKTSVLNISIKLGGLLLPILEKVVDRAIPLIEGTIQWIEQNKELTKWIIYVVAGISAFLAITSIVSFVVGAVTGAIALWSQAMIALNAIIAANPLVVFFVILGLIVVVVYQLIKHWDEWGAAIGLVLGILAGFFSPVIAGLGFIVSLIMSIGRNWDKIANAFSSGNFLQGILLIGSTIMDAIYYPLQQLLELIEKFTGMDLGSSLIKSFRADLGLNTDTPTENDKAVNPKVEQTNIQSSFVESIQKQTLAVDINDNSNGKATVKNSGGAIPINYTSTRSGNFGSR